jgi:DNA repair photolyase
MREIEAKGIIGANNGVNLYRGCSHGCIYCDSRSSCYQVGDFDNIGVKKDCIEIFTRELYKKTKRCVITTGSMCDPYLHLEQELKLTRQMLEVIARRGFGVSILTKSDLVLRDIDLITKINDNYKAIVSMTITSFNDELASKIERNVTTTSKRFECLKAFSDKGVTTGIWMGPILPFINDNEENIINIVRKAGEIGVKYILVWEFGTTMREGSREYFYECLDKYFPTLKERYIKQYGLNYICNSPNQTRLWEVFEKECQKYNIIYKKDEIFAYLSHLNETEQLSLF